MLYNVGKYSNLTPLEILYQYIYFDIDDQQQTFNTPRITHHSYLVNMTLS